MTAVSSQSAVLSLAMSTALLVALGGAAGSLARFGIAGALNSSRHPWGTVTVNLVGSLALGLLIGVWGLGADAAHRTAITVGLLGGFTTFSTFALDTVRLWEDGQMALAVGTVAVSVVGGLLAAVVGLAVGRALVS